MKRMVTQGQWSLWKNDKNLQCVGKVKIMFRAEQPLAVYGARTSNFKNELLLGFAENGEIETLWDQHNAFVRVASEGRVWFKTFESVHAVERTSDTRYTSNERPSALSPEMQAIMRMVKRNELEREYQRSQNQRIQEDLRRIASSDRKDQGGASEPAPAKEAKKDASQDEGASSHDAGKPESDKTGQGPNEAASRKAKTDG